MSANEGGTVRYTVKEVLSRIETKVDALTSLVGTKANANDLTALGQRVDKLEGLSSRVQGIDNTMEIDLKEISESLQEVKDRLIELESTSATKQAVEINAASLEESRSRAKWAAMTAYAAIAGVIINLVVNLIKVK